MWFITPNVFNQKLIEFQPKTKNQKTFTFVFSYLHCGSIWKSENVYITETNLVHNGLNSAIVIFMHQYFHNKNYEKCTNSSKLRKKNHLDSPLEIISPHYLVRNYFFRPTKHSNSCLIFVLVMTIFPLIILKGLFSSSNKTIVVF